MHRLFSKRSTTENVRQKIRSFFYSLKEIMFVGFVSYLVFCVWQLTQPPFQNVFVEEVKLVSKFGPFIEIQKNDPKKEVRSGDTIAVFYHLERLVDGVSIIERILLFPNGEKMTLDTNTRTLRKGKGVVIVNYVIPIPIPEGCGYRVFSRNNITLDLNIISPIISKVTESPVTEFCIKNAN